MGNPEEAAHPEGHWRRECTGYLGGAGCKLTLTGKMRHGAKGR